MLSTTPAPKTNAATLGEIAWPHLPSDAIGRTILTASMTETSAGDWRVQYRPAVEQMIADCRQAGRDVAFITEGDPDRLQYRDSGLAIAERDRPGNCHRDRSRRYLDHGGGGPRRLAAGTQRRKRSWSSRQAIMRATWNVGRRVSDGLPAQDRPA